MRMGGPYRSCSEELADATIVFIALAAHQILVTVTLAREALFRGLVFQAEMLGEAFDVALVEGDDRIRAAVSRAVRAIVLSHLRLWCSRVCTLWSDNGHS